jgi:hypothetical protein
MVRSRNLGKGDAGCGIASFHNWPGANGGTGDQKLHVENFWQMLESETQAHAPLGGCNDAEIHDNGSCWQGFHKSGQDGCWR